MDILKHKKISYVLRKPEGFSAEEKYPLVVYVHGAGGRGSDINVIANHCFFKETEQVLSGAVSVAPQCYADSWFDIFEQLQDFLEMIISTEYVDSSRVYLMGASMGGYTTWQLAMSRPELFTAIVPICGGGMYWNAGRLKDLPVWAFHGDSDPTVLCEESRKMVDGIIKRGGNARLTVYEGVKHDAWTPTFRNAEMWEWLFSQVGNKSSREHEEQYADVKKFG